MKSVGTFGPGARQANPEILVKRTSATARHIASRDDHAVVLHKHDRVISHEPSWFAALEKAKNLARETGNTYRVESFTGVWLVGDEGVTPTSHRRANPAPEQDDNWWPAGGEGMLGQTTIDFHERETRPPHERPGFHDAPTRPPHERPGFHERETKPPMRRANPASYDELSEMPDIDFTDYIGGGRTANPMEISGDDILNNVMTALQPAEEMGGPDGQEYLDLMSEIANEATRRKLAYEMGGRVGNPALEERLLQSRDEEAERNDNPSCGCGHAAMGLSLADVTRRANPAPKSEELVRWEDNEAREDAAALGLPADHVAVAAIGTTDEHLMHEALEVLDGMRPLASTAKKHLIEHLVRYFEGRGGKLHRHAPGGSYRPGEERPMNPIDTASLLTRGMNRAWRVRNVVLPGAVKGALTEIVTEQTPALAALDLASAEGAVSLSQIDAAMLEIEALKKKHRSSKAGQLVTAVRKDLMMIRARPFLHLMHAGAHLGYDLRSYPVNESEIVL